MKFFEVGGAVRDWLRGVECHDVDFAVEGCESFEAMEAELVRQGFEIFLSTPDKFTTRAQVPNGHLLRDRTKVADFVMCRTDSATGDGRRPDFVVPSGILGDLARRDFTVNAMALDPETGLLLDPHGGKADLEANLLRFVGSPEQRISEDGLRVLRGFRFVVAKGFVLEAATEAALKSDLAVKMLGAVSTERVRDELAKMFQADTMATLELLCSVSPEMRLAMVRDLKLDPTSRKRIR